MGRSTNDGAVDRSGKTLDEFLRAYDVTRYFRPSVTVDVLAHCPTEKGFKLLLIKRGGHPYIGDWAFPGGFLEAEEPCETAAARELMEETGVTDLKLAQLVTVSTPGRDPRWRNITVVFAAETDGPVHAEGGDDAEKAVWFDVECVISGDNARVCFSAGEERFECKLRIARDALGRIDLNATKILERGRMAFDHAKIVCYLYEELGR